MTTNPYSFNPGWKIDPDGRQNRGNSAVVTRKMTDEEIKKYGARGENNMPEAKINKEKLIELCKEHGFGTKAYEKMAVMFSATPHSVECAVSRYGIRKLLVPERNKGGRKPAAIVDIKAIAADLEQQCAEVVKSCSVNHPAHYTTGKIETIDYIQDKLTKEQFEGFCVGNALKYISRYKLKGGMEDIKKAIWYLNKITV